MPFITGEMLATSCFSRKVVQLSCNLFGVNLHTFYSEKQLSSHLFGVNLHAFYSEKQLSCHLFWC